MAVNQLAFGSFVDGAGSGPLHVMPVMRMGSCGFSAWTSICRCHGKQRKVGGDGRQCMTAHESQLQWATIPAILAKMPPDGVQEHVIAGVPLSLSRISTLRI